MAQQEMLGGLGEVSSVTAEIQDIAESVKTELEEQRKKKFLVYQGISYSTQVVAGTNYFIKILIGPADDYIHVRIFEGLPQANSKPILIGVQSDKKLCDKINYF